MDKDAILALEGRKLDAKVAEGALEYEWWTYGVTSYLMSLEDGPKIRRFSTYHEGRNGQQDDLCYVPYLSSTWEGMGLIVEAMVAREYLPTFTINGEGLWFAEFFISSDDYGEGWGETAPLAVARAALLALSEEE